MQNLTNPAESDLLLSKEVMAATRISRRTLDRMVEDGRLPVIRIPGGQRRYRRADVEALLTPAAPVEPVSPEAPPAA